MWLLRMPCFLLLLGRRWGAGLVVALLLQLGLGLSWPVRVAAMVVLLVVMVMVLLLLPLRRPVRPCHGAMLMPSPHGTTRMMPTCTLTINRSAWPLLSHAFHGWCIGRGLVVLSMIWRGLHGGGLVLGRTSVVRLPCSWWPWLLPVQAVP